MKTLGIVGGIGPESKIEYYRSIIASCREKAGPDEYPAMLIHSINVVWPRIRRMWSSTWLRGSPPFRS